MAKLIKKLCFRSYMENKAIGSREYRLTWKDYGYDNLMLMAVLALLLISLLAWLIKGVE